MDAPPACRRCFLRAGQRAARTDQPRGRAAPNRRRAIRRPDRCRSEQTLPRSELIMNVRTRRARKPLGKRRAHGSARITNQETRKSQKSRQGGWPIRFTAFNLSALQFFERVAKVIENIVRQQRLLALVAVKNCDLRCASA